MKPQSTVSRVQCTPVPPLHGFLGPLSKEEAPCQPTFQPNGGGGVAHLVHWAISFDAFWHLLLFQWVRKEENKWSQKQKLGVLVEKAESAKWTIGLKVIKNKELGGKMEKCDVMETKREMCKHGPLHNTFARRSWQL